MQRTRAKVVPPRSPVRLRSVKIAISDMRRLTLSWLAALCLGALCGCYESTVPLAPGSASSIDARLLGWWQSVDEAEGSARMLVLAFNPHEYYVEVHEADEEGDEATRLRVFSTRIDGATFGNAQVIDPGEGAAGARPYVFFRYDLAEDGRLRLRYVDDALFTQPPATSEALFAFVQAHLDDPALYLDEADWFEKQAE